MLNNSNLPPGGILNPTTDFFNNYFEIPLGTSPDINDAVTGYFQSITGDADSGTLLAASVISTALTNGLEPMSVIDEFRKVNPNELNAYLVAFLNTGRVPTSFLAISNDPPANKYIQRAILP